MKSEPIPAAISRSHLEGLDIVSLLSAGCLIDASGRKALDLKPGANDVSRLAPGVYFVRSGPSAASRQPYTVRKVVIQH